MNEQSKVSWACHGTTLEMDCILPKSLLVFDYATFGRNNTLAATRCGVPFDRNCELDVHFRLNRACAGRSYCTLPVNSKIFGNPCGFGEFLTVGYDCVQADKIHNRCSKDEYSHSRTDYLESSPLPPTNLSFSSYSKLNPHFSISPLIPSFPPFSSPFFYNLSRDAYYIPDRKSNGLSSSSFSTFATHVGYVSSPNYPKKYQTGIKCTWILQVQPWQSLRIVVSDFELAVKLNGKCLDRLTIRKVGGGISFEECGPIGKQVLEFDGSQAVVTLMTGHRSHAGRGFLLHYEALGPACRHLDEIKHARIVYFHESADASLSANITCSRGFRLKSNNSFWKDGETNSLSAMKMSCHDNRWNEDGRTVCVGESTPAGHDSPVSSNPIFRIGHVTTIHYILTLSTSTLVLALMFIIVCLIYKRRRCWQRSTSLKRFSIAGQRLNSQETRHIQRTSSLRETCVFHQELFKPWQDFNVKRRRYPGEYSSCVFNDNDIADLETNCQLECNPLQSDVSMPQNTTTSNNKPDLTLACLNMLPLRISSKLEECALIQPENCRRGCYARQHSCDLKSGVGPNHKHPPSHESCLTFSRQHQLQSASTMATAEVPMLVTSSSIHPATTLLVFDSRLTQCPFCHQTKS